MADAHLTGPLYIAVGPLYIGGVPIANPTVSAKTSDYTILALDNFTTFTNTGASATVTLTLPTAVDTLGYQFAVVAARQLVIQAAGGASIAIGESISSLNGTITADGASGGLYSYISLRAVSATLWVATGFVGGWTTA